MQFLETKETEIVVLKHNMKDTQIPKINLVRSACMLIQFDNFFFIVISLQNQWK